MTLDQFIDESIRISVSADYHPTTFMSMRQRYGTAAAIKRLVETSEKQSGFHRLQEFGLLDWSLEAAVLKFPDEFPGPKTATYAQARLSGVLDA